jgi:purine nucleoside permease
VSKQWLQQSCVFALAVVMSWAAAAKPSEPVPVKVVVVTMFEVGADEGDRAGEFQLWKERRNLTETFPFMGYRDLYLDPEKGLLVLVTGIGTARSAAAIMALGMDPRFDLTKSYWLVAGIAGFDPEDASIGSAAWAEYLVDGDLSHEIDAREIPEDWPFGYFARYTKRPFDADKPAPTGEMYQLNTGLVNWAFEQTKNLTLPDTDVHARAHRALYTEHVNAQRAPFVLKGDHVAALTFWHGALMNDWANQWVDYWTEGRGDFVSSAMEDTGTYLSLSWLSRVGRVDVSRLLVLRTASNYTMPPPGVTAAENLLAENKGYSGLSIAVESAYQVASKVVDQLIADWAVYENQLPGAVDQKDLP